MAGQDGVRRWPTPPDLFEREQLIAEHGYSALVTVEQDGARSSVLYDGGVSKGGLVHNLDVIGLDPGELRAIVISHSHADHHGGLEGLFRRHRSPDCPS